MAINYSHVSEKVFNLIKGYGFDLQSFDKEGDLVIDPQKATRFVVENPNSWNTVSPSTNKIYFNSY